MKYKYLLIILVLAILIMVGFLMFGRKANPAALTAIDRNDRFADY